MSDTQSRPFAGPLIVAILVLLLAACGIGIYVSSRQRASEAQAARLTIAATGSVTYHETGDAPRPLTDEGCARVRALLRGDTPRPWRGTGGMTIAPSGTLEVDGQRLVVYGPGLSLLVYEDRCWPNSGLTLDDVVLEGAPGEAAQPAGQAR